MKKIKVFVDENINLLAESLQNFADVTTFSGRSLTNKDLINSECEILFTRSQTKINEELLKNSKVGLIATATSGTDHFDLDYLNKSGIEYYSAAGCNANSVAEYVVYSILKWAFINNISLKYKKIGIIGFGNIGKIVAAYSNELGLEVYVNDPPLLDNSFVFPKDIKSSDLKEIFESCDIITNHVPLTFTGKYKTHNLIGNELLNVTKSGNLIIHHSRGGVINETDLIETAKMKNLFMSIDVWDGEPNFNRILAGLSFLATPHIAGYSYNGKLNGTMILLKLFDNYTGIKPNYDLVNFELDKNICKKISDFKNSIDLMNHIETNRRFEYDTTNFKNLFMFDETKVSKEFDLQRKNYPKRYECLKT